MTSAPTVHRDEVDLSGLDGRAVAVLGYGAEAEAHALCLRDSGVDVRIGLPEGARADAAEDEGFAVLPAAEACSAADVVVVAGYNARLPALFDRLVRPALAAGNAVLLTAAGLVRSGPPPVPGVDYALVVPQAPPAQVRRRFTEGNGAPGLVAVHVDATGSCRQVALSYARALGLTHAGVLETTVTEYAQAAEVTRAAFGPSGAGALIEDAFGVLVEAGCDRDVAYLTCSAAARAMSSAVMARGVGGLASTREGTPADDAGLLDRQRVRAALRERL